MNVKYTRKISPDAVTRKRNFDKELELARSQPQKVFDALGEILSEPRKTTIDRVVANRTNRIHVAIEGLYDPHNTAAIMRSADAFGVQNIHIISGSTRFRSSATVTKGAHKWLDVSVYPDAVEFSHEMKRQGIRVMVAAMDGAVEVGSLDDGSPLVLVFGNEADGISDDLRALADGAFCIPMYGFVESFNVSVAAAISLATLRQHGGGDLSEEQRTVLKARYYLRAVRAGYDIVLRS